MEQNLAWIGYVMQLNPLRLEIELEHKRGIDELLDAEEGVNATRSKQYPLILLNDVIPAGNLRIPEGIRLDDWLEVGCYVIEQIKMGQGLNRSTPIVVTTVGIFPGHPFEYARLRYKSSGATEVFKFSPPSDKQTNFFEDFNSMIRKYLK